VAEEAAARAPLLEELREELAVLKNASDKSWQELVKVCYQKFPPKNTKAGDDASKIDDTKTSQWTAANGKLVLRTCIVAYHPDKNSQCGTKWSTLCEEMVKLLNSKYEAFKR
jgi:hypothetical protein